MKKLGLVSFVVLSLLLTACGSGNGKGEKKTLTVFQNKAEMTEPLQAYANAWGEKNDVEVTVKTCTGACDYGAQMKADINAGEAADIFLVEGESGYNLYKDIIAPLDGEKWTEHTSYAFKQNDSVFGYPVAVEGWGLAYNKDMMDKAGVDISTLNSLEGYQAAFEKVSAMKDELGIIDVVANVSAEGHTWVMGNHDFAAYLSAGLASDDKKILDLTLEGKVDEKRLNDYADWVELLFNYTDEKLLTVGSADDQFALFGEGKYAFMHQGTWADINVKNAGGEFEMGFAPYGSLGSEKTEGLFIGSSSYYVVNKDSKQADTAKAFLNDLAMTEEGQKMLVEEAQLISAFTNNSLKPELPLSKFVADWIVADKPAYSFTNQYSLPDGFGTNTLGQIFGQFANKKIDKAKFVELVTDAISKIPSGN
ncbi:ABC transporter substrate-binding protein [Erysipelothrix urinaevulpis]|uniref:ABC transporter substrate-binding protein n=1 Tax=Erysipelothrix urinaevulpis TaxID=2683717 RepID=UPI00135CA09F|nr:ABC transporter substrate-binding protein [Erysipelothrix urinaevulpis]